MAGDLFFGSDQLFSVQDLYTSALHFGADGSFDTTRTSDTVTSDAISGSVPIDNSQGTGWQDFFRDTAKAIVGYSLAKDAAKSGVAPTPQAAATMASSSAAAAANNRTMTWMMIGAAAVGAFLIARK